MAATLQDLLTEASAAYHQLLIGQSVVSIIDQNGEKITYGQASQRLLAAYIESLKAQIAGTAPVGPMRLWGR